MSLRRFAIGKVHLMRKYGEKVIAFPLLFTLWRINPSLIGYTVMKVKKIMFCVALREDLLPFSHYSNGFSCFGQQCFSDGQCSLNAEFVCFCAANPGPAEMCAHYGPGLLSLLWQRHQILFFFGITDAKKKNASAHLSCQIIDSLALLPQSQTSYCCKYLLCCSWNWQSLLLLGFIAMSPYICTFVQQ